MICRRVLGQTCWMFFHRLVDVGVVLVVDMGVVFVVVDRVDSVDSDNNMKRRIGVAWYISEFQFGQWFPLLHFIVTRWMDMDRWHDSNYYCTHLAENFCLNNLTGIYQG